MSDSGSHECFAAEAVALVEEGCVCLSLQAKYLKVLESKLGFEVIMRCQSSKSNSRTWGLKEGEEFHLEKALGKL